ncbi:MAG: HAMP domain-containing histidine kinase [Cyanobacteria bacterium]|nr:HAMP domain-containing histidine kinase [Cyanobacteriota bacterium]
MRSKIASKGLILVGVPLIFELLFVSLLLFLFNQAASTSERALKSKLVLAETESTLNGLWDAFQQFGLSIATRKPINQANFQTTSERAIQKIKLIKSMVGNDPVQQKNIDRLKKAVEEGYRDVSLAANAYEEDQPFAGGIYPQRLAGHHRSFIGLSEAISKREIERQSSMPISSGNFIILLNLCVGLGIGLNIAIAFLMANYFSKGITNRISAIVDNVQNMKSDRDLAPLLEGEDDEISVLDKEFHAMASFMREARKKEQALVGNVRSVICSLSKNLTFTKVSDEASRIWGARNYLSESLSLVCQPEDWPGISSRFAECMASRDLSSEMDIQMLPQRGAPIWMHWTIFWSREHELFFCVANDISQQKELQDIKRDFAQMISHDLRSPLQSVQTFVEVLGTGLYGTLNERGTPRVASMNRTLSHLIRLINNLLDLEKMDAGKLELSYQEASLKDLVETSFEFIGELATKRKLQVKIDIDPAIRLTIDADKMIQVFQNLLGNAVKYSPIGAPLEVRSRLRGAFVEVEIVDQGKGIPLDQQEKIFDRFHQVKDPHGVRVAGTGLGLAFCKQIIDMHGGQIGVESKDGAGSCFWLLLPLQGR